MFRLVILFQIATLAIAQIGLAQSADSWEPFADEPLLSDAVASYSIYPDVPQFGGHIAEDAVIAPDIQLIVGPALNPSEDVLALFGIRMRAAF